MWENVRSWWNWVMNEYLLIEVKREKYWRLKLMKIFEVRILRNVEPKFSCKKIEKNSFFLWTKLFHKPDKHLSPSIASTLIISIIFNLDSNRSTIFQRNIWRSSLHPHGIVVPKKPIARHQNKGSMGIRNRMQMSIRLKKNPKNIEICSRYPEWVFYVKQQT